MIVGSIFKSKRILHDSIYIVELGPQSIVDQPLKRFRFDFFNGFRLSLDNENNFIIL